MSAICPQCGREAPLVYKGVVPYCAACGALRAPLSSAPFHLAGKPSKVGGTVASVAGWLVLLVGFSAALGLGLLLWAFLPGAVALAVALPLALITGGVGAALLRGGSSLRASGQAAEMATRDQALISMTAHNGPMTAVDAARMLNITVAAADAMLTELAKRDPERIAVDVDDQGIVWYRIARPFDVAGQGGGIRVDAQSDAEAMAEAEAVIDPAAAERRRLR
jgi:hypothetical protein